MIEMNRETQVPGGTVLMLSYSYPPRRSASTFRVIRFTRHLPEFGWRCVVVTPHAECYPGCDDELLKQVHPLTEVHRFACGDPAEHLKRWMTHHEYASGGAMYLSVKVLHRLIDKACVPDSRVLGSRRLLRESLKVISRQRVDAVWLTGPPFSTFGIVPALKRKTGLPVMLDLRDPWTTGLRYSGLSRWKYSLERRQERRAFELADRVILNTHYALNQYRALYPDLNPERWGVLPNTYDPEDFSGIQPERFPKKVLLHAGMSGGIRTARWLIEAMGRLRREGRVDPESFRYISYGPGGHEEHEAVAQAGVGDMVEFRGSRPHREVLSAMTGSDALLLLVGKGHEASIPSKLYEYMAVGRPVLMAGPPDCAAADVIRETGIGKVVPLEDTDGLISCLKDILDGRLTERRSQHEGVKAYQTRSVVQSLASLLDALVANRAASAAPVVCHGSGGGSAIMEGRPKSVSPGDVVGSQSD